LLTNPEKAELYWEWVKPIADKVLHLHEPPANGDQARLLSIVSGEKTKPVSDCAADNDGSRVQIFEHGLFLIRFSTNQVYAVMTDYQDEILWLKKTDESKWN
jgi:hypothetical protein